MSTSRSILGYSIRNGTEHYWPFVEDLYAMNHVRVHMHPPTHEQYLASIVREDCFNFIIERDGQPFGNFKADLAEPWLMTFGALAVKEPRKGAGRFALNYAINLAFRELGVHRIFLEITETNAASRLLCEAVGFRGEGLYRDGYRDDAGLFHNLIPYGMLATDVQSNDP